MRLQNGAIRVTDFGIARVIDKTKTKTGIVMGTPSYMSPEQVAGKKVDRHVLKSGDTIVIGEHKLRFMVPGDAPPPKASKPMKSRKPIPPGGEKGGEDLE